MCMQNDIVLCLCSE